MNVSVKCIWNGCASLGEGVLWDAERSSVWFVDIDHGILHEIKLPSNKHRVWHCPSSPCFIALCKSKPLLIGLAKGLYSFIPERGEFIHLIDVEAGVTENRINDGAVGPDGAIWFGTKNELENQSTGAWYKWRSGETPSLFDSGYVVTNGPAFSPSGTTMYHSDSTGKRVLSRAVDSNGSMGPNNTFVTIDDKAGYPDGLAVDTEGCLWVALWGGGAVRRYSPQGNLLREIKLPVSNVTKPAFGGQDYRTLYVTSASTGLSDSELCKEPLAGSVFAIDAEVAGLPLPKFSLPPVKGFSFLLD